MRIEKVSQRAMDADWQLRLRLQKGDKRFCIDDIIISEEKIYEEIAILF